MPSGANEDAIQKFKFLAEQRFGEDWRSALAERAEVSERAIRYWTAGERSVPEAILSGLESMARETPTWKLLKMAISLDDGMSLDIRRLQDAVWRAGGEIDLDSPPPAWRGAFVCAYHATLAFNFRGPFDDRLRAGGQRMTEIMRGHWQSDLAELTAAEPPIWLRWASPKWAALNASAVSP